MDRRSFLGGLAAAGLVGLSGCTSTTPTPMPTRSGTGPAPLPSDDDELRRITADAEHQLIALYATAIRGASPALAEQLRALQEQHAAHAQRLMPGQPVTLAPVPTSPSAASASATPSPTEATQGNPPTASGDAEAPDPRASASPSPNAGSPGPTASAIPSPRAVLADLRRAELAALDQRREACAQASGPELVRSLCLIAASEAQHADVLTALRGEVPR